MDLATPPAGAEVPREVPTQITDFSCVTQYEEACADIEAWLRTCAAADGGDGGSAAVLLARDRATQVPWCRAHPFHYPLRQTAQGAAALGKQTAAAAGDADDARTVNCVAELFGTLDGEMKPTEPLLHPIALHFGVSSFLLVRYDGASSRKAPEASALLSIAAAAAQQANLSVACFAPASCDDEGGFRGVLHCPVGSQPLSGICAPDFHRTRPTSAPLPLTRGPAGCEKHRATSAHFRTQTIAMTDLYHTDHGAAPSSTLEGVAELFQLNAGRSTKFVAGDRDAGENLPTSGGKHRKSPAISANMHKLLQVSPPLGELWDHFTEAELNAVDEIPLGSGRPPPTEPLDATTPRALFLSAPPDTCGRSVPLGTSVAPFRHIDVAVRWLRFDAVSAAVVDNPARSAFCELTDERHGATPASDAAETSDTRPIPPSAVDLGITWRAHSEVSSIAADNVRECIHVVSSTFADNDDGDRGEEAAADNAGGAMSREEDEARRQEAREAVYGAAAELPTEARVRHHAKAVLNVPATGVKPAGEASAGGDVSTLAERFAHECTHLRSSDEMYRLWLAVVDSLTQAFDGAPSDLPAAAAVLSDELRLQWLATVLGHCHGGATESSGVPLATARGVPTTLEAKLEALATCLADELADRRRALPTASLGSGSARPASKKADGWGDGDASMSSARSATASDSAASSRSPSPNADADVAPDAGSSSQADVGDSSQRGAFDLLNHPGVPARLPRARRRAPVTPDEARRHQRELLAGGDGVTARQHRVAAQVEDSALLEDMCRFKHANTTAQRANDGNGGGLALAPTLADFVRWYSPKDFVAGPDAVMPPGASGDDPEGLRLLSKRMQSADAKENAWLAAWARAVPQPLPDLAYSPLAHGKRLLKQLAAETQEDVGTLVASLVPRMAARRLMNARVWRFHRSVGGTVDPVLLELRAIAVGMFRAAIKSVPTDEELGQACTSAAAWCSAFATALTRIETLDIFTSFVSTAVRMLAGGRADASVDGFCCLLGADGPTHANPGVGSETPRSPFLQWRFVDQMLARQWRKAPWAHPEAGESEPTEGGVTAATVKAARRRIRGLPATLAEKLQPTAGTLDTVPMDVWSSWLGWRLLRSIRPLGAAGARRPQRRSVGEGVPSLPLRVGGQDICLGAGVDPDHVILAVKRMELWGYAARPVAKADLGVADGGHPSVAAPLSLQCMTASFDGEAGVAYYGLGVSECVRLF